MSISQFIQRNLSSLSRNAKKRQIIAEIQNTAQQNIDVVNIHRIDENNVGDFYCAPHHYYEPLKGKQLDIFDFKSDDASVREHWKDMVSTNALVIGGGGLLNRGSFDMQLKLFESLYEKGKKTVLWGVGHNEKDKNRFGKVRNYTIDTSNFGMVGVRDFSMQNEWVPCVSCKHDIFDRPYTTVHELGIIFHKKTIKDKRLLQKLERFPSTSNTKNLEDMVSFIGSVETLVTDSYHAMYWAMLLGKKVIAVPNSSKFYDFKYKPVFSSFDNFQNDLHKAVTFDGVLEECRSINDTFSEKVFNYLNV